MKPQSLSKKPQYQSVLCAWRQQVNQASEGSNARQRLLLQEPELLPRFNDHYAKLKALPRRMRRALQRQWKRSLAGVALLLALGQAPALAATINVGGACTLIDAITAANTDAATGDCTTGAGADTIRLPANSTQSLTAVNNDYFGPNGLPVISSAITIDGNGATIKRAPSAPDFRILAVDTNGNLKLRRTTVSGGRIAEFEQEGGGLLNYGGVLSLQGSTISGNRTLGESGDGGGIGMLGTPDDRARLIVNNSKISRNAATSNYTGGGGVYSAFGSVIVSNNSTISGNSTVNAGGGVYMYAQGALTIANSTISGNKASGGFSPDEPGFGGGVATDEGTRLTITNSTISSNSGGASGGVSTYSNPARVTNSTISGNKGSGLVNLNSGNLELTNSTISGNRSTDVFGGGGGGLVNFGTLDATHSTVTDNKASYGGGIFNNFFGALSLARTVVAGNTAASGAEVFNGGDPNAIITAGNFNLFGHRGLTNARAFENFTPGTTDITATSDGDTPTALNRILNTRLADNGGRTRTHALVADSPAIDSVSDGTCPPPSKDQRGVRRPRDGNGDGGAACDTGSFER